MSQVKKRRGRPRLYPAMVPVNVHMTPVHREKFKRLGGSAWLRHQIEKEESK